MKRIATCGLALALLTLVSVVRAEEVKSGPQPGEHLGAFDVVKVAGAPEDGVEVGKELCYRCKLGNRPVVMVFAREADDQLATLVKELDQVVAKNKEEKKLASFVNLLGDDVDALSKKAESLVKSTNASNVAFVVPQQNQTGPENYKIDPKAEVTVLIYKNGTVEANHAFSELKQEDVKKVIADTSKILK